MQSGKIKPGYKFCDTHMIFDIKMDGQFMQKVWLVADGHKTNTPSSITSSSVVSSRDSVRMVFTIVMLNYLEVMACDIGNAYLNAPCQEKLWMTAGPEFGSGAGSVMTISRALYGLKTSGAAWMAKFADTLRSMGYKASESNLDVWMKKDFKESGEPYYKYILVYVVNVLHIYTKGKSDMDRIGLVYRLKEGRVAPPERHLGANIKKVQLDNGSTAWVTTSADYMKTAITQVQSDLEEDNVSLKMYGKGSWPYLVDYRLSKELGAKLTNRYQQLIGTL